MQGQPETGLEVTMEFSPLAVLLSLCTPTIVVDGEAHRKSWGTHLLELEPGRHSIKIFFRYLFMAEFGASSIDVLVEEGKISRIKYSVPLWLLVQKPSIKEL